MKIRLENGKPASQEEILALEASLGSRLSGSFKHFLESQDGAKPQLNIFLVDQQYQGRVNRFIPISEIEKKRRYIENIPEKAYPVAVAEGGNFVFIDEGRKGAVFFWDHETAEI